MSFVIPSEVEESLIVAFCFAARIERMKKIISTSEAPEAIGPY
jgi:hypothetical protein